MIFKSLSLLNGERSRILGFNVFKNYKQCLAMKKKPVSKKSSKYDLLRLDNQLCFALYAATSAMTRTYMTRLQPLGITYPQYLVLLVLWEEDDVAISDIGERLKLGTGTLTPLIKRLETQKLVKRLRDRRDERVVRVCLTDKGVNLKDDALEARLFVACSLGMKEKEIMSLRSELIEMIDQLESCADAPDVE